MSVDGEKIYAQLKVPYNMINMELEGIYGKRLLRELGEIIKYYDIYDKGATYYQSNYDLSDDPINTNDIRCMRSANLVDKQARFMFATAPDINIEVDKNTENSADVQSIYQRIIDKVRSETKLDKKLLKAARDCFIGKRVAYTVNFDDKTGKINISFVPSIGFVYATDSYDTDVLTKLVIFYAVNDVEEKEDQIYYKKKHEMVNGKCVITEGLYNGYGQPIDEKDEIRTDFEYIPGGVIINGGLTGDISGESDIAKIAPLEACYNKMSNKDLDAECKGMNPITYTIDMDSKSTADLPIVAGSYWDLNSDANADGKSGQLGTIEPKMEYSSALDTTLERIRANSFEMLDIPDTSSKAMQGVVTSGKTLKAIYWSLMVRCDEKFNEWRDALENIARTILDGCAMYDNARKRYVNEAMPSEPYEIKVVNNYPIQDDANEEKEMDLQEVHNKVRSKKSYMKKYFNLTDSEIDNELQQIAKERQIEESSYSLFTPGVNQSATPSFNDMLNNKNAANTNNI